MSAERASIIKREVVRNAQKAKCTDCNGWNKKAQRGGLGTWPGRDAQRRKEYKYAHEPVPQVIRLLANRNILRTASRSGGGGGGPKEWLVCKQTKGSFKCRNGVWSKAGGKNWKGLGPGRGGSSLGNLGKLSR